MTIVVEIRRNGDGAVSRKERSDLVFSDFWWTEGNAACDCNRCLFFHDGRGEKDFDEPACGTGAYAVRITNIDGVVLLDEWGPVTGSKEEKK